jgi:hypothetical protein
MTSLPALGVPKGDDDAPVFEVWESRRVWSGHDQEEALLTALQLRQPGNLIEVEEIFESTGELRFRCIAAIDDRKKS